MRDTCKTFCLEDFKCDFLTLHPYYIYPHNPQKQRGYLERKTLHWFSTTQHTHLLERELLILNEKSLQSLLPSLSHCHTLRGDLYPNTIHTFSECRECFGAWKALGICQKKPMRLGECNQAYCRIWKVSEDKTSRSPLVTEAWRAQVHWIDQIWRVFCYSCTLTYSLVDRFRLGGSRRGFSLSSSISSSITRLGVILYLRLSSLTLVLYFFCLLFMSSCVCTGVNPVIVLFYSCSTLSLS